MAKKKQTFGLKVKVDGVPVCNGVFSNFDDLEKGFEEIKKKVK